MQVTPKDPLGTCCPFSSPWPGRPQLQQLPNIPICVQATVNTYFKVQPRIRKAVEGFALLFALIATGAVMLHVTDGSEGRQLTWLDCWYWSITTISTVGYGDIVPSQHKVAFACFFLVTVVLFAYLLGESVALVTEIKRYRRMDEFFSKGLPPEILDAMDIFRDGQVRSPWAPNQWLPHR